MEQALQNFINTYNGIPNVGDTPQNEGQCVGLSDKWADDTLKLPHLWGNAKDLMANANPNSYDIIYNDINDLTLFPIAGDIFVCGSSWGGGYGHTGVITDATGSTWTAFEQNNPEGHAPQILTHNNYNGMLGWLRPKVTLTPPTPPTPEDPLLAKWRELGNTGDMPIGWHGETPLTPQEVLLQQWRTLGNTGDMPVGWNGQSPTPNVPTETPTPQVPTSPATPIPPTPPTTPVEPPVVPPTSNTAHETFSDFLAALWQFVIHFFKG